MSAPVFKSSKAGPECPSELSLDRWQQSELDASQKIRLDAHVPDCPSCQARIQERAALMDSLSGSERAHVIDRLMQAARAPAVQEPWWRRLFAGGSMMPAYAAALALVLVFFSLRVIRPPEGTLDGVLSKGGLALTVYREHDGSVERARSGEGMEGGDRLRFGVEVPSAGHIMIIGVEADGSSYVCHPSSGSARSVPIAAGRTDALPGAVELDDSTGREELHLIHCPEAFRVEDVTPVDASRLASRRCALTSFELSKRGP